MASLLQLENVHTGYGPIEVLKGIDLTVNAGEIVTVLGANGAGKSTLLMTISGVLPCRRGTITFAGTAIQNRPAEEIVGHGLSQAPEGRLIFPRLTVRENLEMGAFQSKEPADLARAYRLFPILKERQAQPGGTLSGGEQQMLAIGRSIMSSPKLLMLDEPTMGLAPMMKGALVEGIRNIWRSGLTILFVEQDAILTLNLTERVYILDHGKVGLEGKSQELINNEEVKRVYFQLG
jgi:branched-chain amino acid transport system ATP-binding protein